MKSMNINSKRNTRVTRRDFLKISKILTLSLLAAVGGGSYLLRPGVDWLGVTDVRLALPHLPASFSGMRIAQISDIHIGGWIDAQRLKYAFDQIRQLAPDLLVITGDFVLNLGRLSSTDADMLTMETEMTAFSSLFPTLAVLGNHDHGPYQPVVTAMLARSGVGLLENSVRRLQSGSDSLFIAGVRDVLERQSRLESVLSQLPGQDCAILLAHEPDFADTSAAARRFDLQLSGHSHGGQVNLPFIGAPVLPKLGRKYPQGLYKVGDMALYTNRGIGMGPPYIRLNCPAEITLFTLTTG